jgi:hypothetical protein
MKPEKDHEAEHEDGHAKCALRFLAPRARTLVGAAGG